MEDAIPDEALIEMGREPDDDIAPSLVAPILSHTATLPHLLTGLSLPQRLTTMSLPTDLSFPPLGLLPSPHPPTTSVLSTLHLRALEALNNLLLTTTASLPGDSTAALQIVNAIPSQGVWDGMFRIIEIVGANTDALVAKGQEMRLEVVEMAMRCLWGLAKLASGQIVSLTLLHRGDEMQ